MAERASTKHDIQRDELNTTRPNYSDVTNILVSGTLSMWSSGVDPGTGQVIIYNPPTALPSSQVGLFGQNAGVPLGTGTTLNVNGSRLLLGISGTVLNLTNSPDPQEVIGIFGISGTSSLGTGTSLVVGNYLGFSISGTFLYLAGSVGTDVNRLATGDRGVTGGDTHNHTGSNGGLIPSGGIASHAVTYNKIQQLSANVILGNPTSGLADVAEISVAPDPSAWIPTFSGLSIGSGTLNTGFIKIGKLVIGHLELTFANNTTISGDVTFTLPVTQGTYLNINAPIGLVRMSSAGAGYLGVCTTPDTSHGRVVVSNASSTYLQNTALSSGTPGLWTTNDFIQLQFVYFAA